MTTLRKKVNGHFIFSSIKSIVRVAAGVFLATGNFLISGALFIIAEILGVAEELV